MAALERLPNNDFLVQAISELRKNPFSPEAVTNYWRAKIEGIVVPDCDWTEDKIRKPMVDIKGKPVETVMIYNPKELMGKEGLIRLGKMFPEIRIYAVDKDTLITDTHETSGWIKGYAALNGVNLNTTQKELENFAKREGYLGGRLRSYILASQAIKDIKGHYLDESTWSRLLGSRDDSYGYVAYAFFLSNGRLGVFWRLGPNNRSPRVGGWFEGVKKA